jgi:hypothetical protein
MKSLFQNCSSRPEEAPDSLQFLKSEPRYPGCYLLNLSPCI